MIEYMLGLEKKGWIRMMLRLRQKLCLALLLFFLFFIASTFPICAQAETKATVIETNIGIQPSDYKKMIATKAENRFYVNVSANNGAVHRAKIHIRGNASKEIGFASPTKRLPIELRFAETSDYSDQIYNTYVDFANAPAPARLVAEYLAFEMFAFLDIPTPAHTFAFLQYNDVDFGLYHALEAVNQIFLEKSFSAPFGSLYKSVNTSQSGHSYSSSQWFGDLEVKIDQGSERIDALMDALNRGEGYEEYMDVDEFLRFFACTAAYGGYNSILTELTGFYLYDDHGKFILLPWDNSDAFMEDKTENGIDHFQLEYWEDAPACFLFDLLMQDTNNRETYHNYIRKLNNQFLAPEALDPLFQSLASLIRPYLLRDHTVFLNAPYDLPVSAEEKGYGTLESLLCTLHRYHDNLNAQLNGSENTFFYNSELDAIPVAEQPEQLDQMIDYLVHVSPSIDPDITNKICVGYSDYCRSRGITHFSTGDPAEYVVTFILFGIVLGIALFSVWRPQRRSGFQKKTQRSDNQKS